MPNYGWYLTQLSTFVYVPIFAVLSGTGAMQHAKPGLLFKFAMMGVFDGLSGTLMVLGGVHTSGTMQVLLSQAVIPTTIILSYFLLRKRYHILQQAGAGIIVVGIVLAKAMSGSSADSGNQVVFNVIFFCAVIPNAASSVFKEVAFKGFDGDLDVNVLQFWVAAFQVVTNFVAMPIYTLPVLGAQQVPLSRMPALMTGGTRCLFFLEDQVKLNCGFADEPMCDHCATAWVPVVIFLMFNIMCNVFTILVIKHGSAALSFLISTLRMPLAALAFSSPAVMGAEAVPAGPQDLFCLAVIIVGLSTYRYGGVLLQRREPAELASPGGADESPPFPSPRSDMSPASALSTPLKGTRRPKWARLPLFSFSGVPAEPSFVQVRTTKVVPRSAVRVRYDLYHKLGAASPLNSPQFRHLSPHPSPTPSPRPILDPVAFDSDVQLPAAAADFDLTGLAQS
mmetsp:Transcript_107128/g.299904  ORF Transcript_107128/g.299904 Transcript_107128/m.299904 type:complete len:451 (+) Transcript_107128:2-1354(+)